MLHIVLLILASSGAGGGFSGAGRVSDAPRSSAPLTLTALPCDGVTCTAQLVADDWDGSAATWTARVGSNNATKRGSPTLGNSATFTGRKSIAFGLNNSQCMTLPGDTLTSTDKRSYEILIDDWSTGNSGMYVFARYDAGTLHQLFNFLFKTNATGLESAMYNDGASGVYLGAAPTPYTNVESKPVAFTITIDLTVPRYRVYQNGTQILQDLTTSGSFGTAASQVLGIGCRWNQSAASPESFGGKIMEFLRHNIELDATTVASRLTTFNALKGY